MCMSELPQHLYTDETARAAVHVIGERATLDTLTDMVSFLVTLPVKSTLSSSRMVS